MAEETTDFDFKFNCAIDKDVSGNVRVDSEGRLEIFIEDLADRNRAWLTFKKGDMMQLRALIEEIR